jgi:hypothetical protein
MTGQRTVLVATIAMLAFSAHLPIFAQDDLARSGTGSSDDETVCMARVYRDVPQVRKEQKGVSFAVIVVRTSTQSLVSKGFAEIDCQDAKLSTLEQQRKYREDICEMAANGNQAVQNQYERALGERPAILCANAQLATGVQRNQLPKGGR